MLEYIIGGSAALLAARVTHRAFRKHIQPKLKGYFGELSVKRELKKIASENTVILHDLLLSNGRSTTQLDHVVISEYGVFAIETKNYSGLITGGEWDQKWQQQTSSGLHVIPNPVRQNYRHIQTLRPLVTQESTVPIHSVIVFSDKSQLDVSSERTQVINRRDLRACIRAMCKRPVLSASQVRHIQKQLEDANIRDPAERRKHKAQVRVVKELFGADALSKAYEEGKSSPIVRFSSQPTLGERLLQEKLEDYHARGPCLTIRGSTDTIAHFLRDARRNADGTVAQPNTPADHILCPYTGDALPSSEEQNLERGLWISYLSQNPELAHHITTKAGFQELFPTQSNGARIAAAYTKAPASYTAKAKQTLWYKNLESSFRKPSVDSTVKDAQTRRGEKLPDNTAYPAPERAFADPEPQR